MVEYQRYLALGERPAAERARALLELGFIHLVLGDEATAQARAMEAYELDATVELGPNVPARQLDYARQARKAFFAQARLEPEPPRPGDLPSVVRVRLVDPQDQVSQVLLRYAEQGQARFLSVLMRCEQGACSAAVPLPPGATRSTASYFVEGLDRTLATVARLAGPDAALQLRVAQPRPWYESPVVWGLAGVVLVGAAALVLFLAPPPPPSAMGPAQ